MRNRLAHLLIALGVVVWTVSGALAPQVGPPPAEAQQAPGPVRVGILAPLTGVVAVIGKGEVNGIKLRLKELNYEIAGRKIEVIVEDSAGDPLTALTKARKLVERDKVDIFLGPLLSHIQQAVQEYTGPRGVPQIILVSGLPETNKYPSQVSPGWNGVSIGQLFGEYAYRKLGHRKMVMFSTNFPFGRRNSDGFREGFTQAGGAIVKEVYPPLGTPDFAPFLAGLPQADAVYSFLPGADAVRYVKQRAELGLNERLPLLSLITTVEGILLPAQGDAALGSVAITHYFEDLDNPVNRHFVAAYAKEYGEPPRGYNPALGYSIGQIVEEALKRTGGKTTPPETLINAIRQVDISTTQGRLRFDPEKRFGIMDFYIVKVVKKEGKLGYEVMDVLKDIKP
jgi:branched-chain amino acid transport system substrate-binding protein